MRCQEIAGELDAYLTGELSGDTLIAVESHLRECPSCRAELELLREETAVYGEYASVVAAAIGEPEEKAQPIATRSSPATFWWKWAAAAAVLVAALLLWRFYAAGGAPEIVIAPTSGGTAAFQVDAARSFDKALSQLQAAYAEKREGLDPELAKEVDHNLEIARTAVEECKRALREHPDNQQALAFLLHDYQMQTEILRQITEAL